MVCCFPPTLSIPETGACVESSSSESSPPPRCVRRGGRVETVEDLIVDEVVRDEERDMENPEVEGGGFEEGVGSGIIVGGWMETMGWRADVTCWSKYAV